MFSATRRGSLWLGYWTGQPSAAGCEAAAASICGFARARGGKVTVLAVLGPQVQPSFGSDVREAAVDATRAISEVMERGAVVIDRRGLVAALVVSLSTGLLLLARARTVRVFVDTDEAARWLVDPGSCADVLDQVGRLHAVG